MIISLSIIFSFFYLSQSTADLYIEVTGVKEARGYLMVAVYRSDQEFPGEDMFLSRKLPIDKPGKISFSIPLPEGKYAISVFHDRNADDQLNKNFFGIPKEPYGFSIERGIMGPPSFEEASFMVPERRSITIGIE